MDCGCPDRDSIAIAALVVPARRLPGRWRRFAVVRVAALTIAYAALLDAPFGLKLQAKAGRLPYGMGRDGKTRTEAGTAPASGGAPDQHA